MILRADIEHLGTAEGQTLGHPILPDEGGGGTLVGDVVLSASDPAFGTVAPGSGCGGQAASLHASFTASTVRMPSKASITMSRWLWGQGNSARTAPGSRSSRPSAEGGAGLDHEHERGD